MKQHDVFVVIPNWNGKEWIGNCLRSLTKQTLQASIVVVDNGSKDGSAEYIKQYFPNVVLIERDKNYGFTGGVNAGIEYALKHNAKYVALFNNDAVASTTWLAKLVATMERQPHTGIVTGKFMHIDKKHIDSTGEFIRKNGMPYSRGRGEVDKGQYDTAGFVFAATGGASLYRAEMLKQIGLFDNDYFAYFEDVDISFRAQLRGWHVYYQPEAVAHHHIGKTSSKLGSFRRYHSVKNYILLYNKNMPGMLYWKYKPLFVLQLVRMKLGALRDQEFGAYIKAFWKGTILMPSTLLKRRTIQRHRTIPANYIMQFIGKGSK